METLRFKNNGDHYQEKLILKNSQVLKERKESLQKDNGLPHVSLTKNGIVLKTDRYNRDFLVKNEDKKYKVTKIGDLCYNPANLKFGVITINEQIKGVFSPIYVTFEISKKMNIKFAKYFYTREKYINKLRKFEEGTVYERMAVKPSDFLKVEITLPSLYEQEKIGGFLSSFDKLIQMQQEKIDLLKDLKKGYLQQMFPTEGSNISKIRFKGFKDAWEQYKLSQLYVFSKGRGLSLDSFYEGNDSLGIAYGHLYTKYGEVINKVTLSTYDESGVLSRKGDLLFPGSSTVPFGTAQSNAIMLDNVKLGGDVIIARAKNLDVYAPFISYQINAQKSKLFPITVGITITHMYGKDIAKIEYKFPKYDEQEKIGRTLEGLDSLITLHQRKLESIEEIKKGYMQRLFA